MKILLIYTLDYVQSNEKPIRKFEWIYFGISIISAVLKQNGYQTDLLVMTRETPFQKLTETIKDFKPDIIGFTSVASEFEYICSIGEFVKEHFPDIYRVIGGVHVSIFPKEEYLNIFDAICIGEGEYPILELVQALEKQVIPSGIKNLWLKIPDKSLPEGWRIEKNPTRNFIEDLDSLPYMDREIWQKFIPDEAFKENQRPSVVIGRGCPFNCNYCCNHALKKISGGKYARYRSPRNIIGEIETLEKYYPMQNAQKACQNCKSIEGGGAEVYLEVESFGADIEWSLKLCEALEQYNKTRENKLTFKINYRINPGSYKDLDKLFSAMKRAGFTGINVGLESGSERVRKEALNRQYSNEDVLKCVQAGKKYNINVVFQVMLGLPTETIKDFNMTIDLIKDNNLEYFDPSIFYPYPGTNSFDYCQKHRLLKSHINTRNERVRSVIDFPYFSKAQIQKAWLWFRYYTNNKPLTFDEVFVLILNSYFTCYNKKWEKKFIPLFFALDAFLPSRNIRDNKGDFIFSLRFLFECFRRYMLRLIKIFHLS